MTRPLQLGQCVWGRECDIGLGRGQGAWVTGRLWSSV